MLARHKKTTTLNERGFASIVIALVLIIVLALITVGFAQLARREQRDALNKQLANQAYFAAESGINDVMQALPAIEADAANVDSTKCLDTARFSLKPNVNQTNGVSYTCVLVNLKPPDLQYSDVPADSQRYSNFTSEPGALTSLTVHWGSADGKNLPRSNNGFPPLSQWGNSPAVLEVSLTPMSASQSNASLSANTFSAVLYPSSAAGGLTFNTSNQGQVTSGSCVGAGKYSCSATISGIPAAAGEEYLIRVVTRYDASTNISINGQTASGKAVFTGQTQIDVTGKAHEVLKRLQVRISRNQSYDLPKDVIQAQSGCKRFTADPLNAPQADLVLSDACKVDN